MENQKDYVNQLSELSPFRFQQRDEMILNAIHEHDGVLARRQLKFLFWRSSTWRAMERRLAKLHQAGYISWPDITDRKRHAIPEPIVWIDWRGASILSGKQGIDVVVPEKVNENGLRLYERRLRESGFSWLREPRWSQLGHDLMISDIRLWVKESLSNNPTLILEEWINESTFRSDPDYVEYKFTTRSGKVLSRRKAVCPDGMFTLVDLKRKNVGQPYRARYLVEVDMATHDNPSFGNDKVAAGLAYVRGRQYQSRFGSNSGRWLIITTGETRMRNLMQETRERVSEDGNVFYFTTFNQMKTTNFFFSPIWSQTNKDDPQCLLLTLG